MQSVEKKKITIVINTYNRATLLENTLLSLQCLDYDDFEVVVINGPSTDGTDDLLKKWSDKIKIGKCPEANLSISRNIGIAMAAGDFIAFIDDDAIPEAEWLTQAMDGFDSEEVSAVGGKVFDRTGYKYQYEFANANRLGNCKWQLHEPSPHYCYPYAYEFPYLQGTNTIFRKSALIEVGGFDEEFIYYLDETEVCLKLIDRGYFIKQLNDAYVHHKYAPSNIRTKKVAVNRYPVLKSKIYFSNRHGRPYHNQEEIDADNKEFLQNHRDDINYSIKLGDLTHDDMLKFEEHAAQAWIEGKRAANQPAKLITPELLRAHASSFKKFPVIFPDDGQKLVIVLLCEDYPPNLLGGIARFTQDKANGMARLGHKVHVIARAQSMCTVDFENGVWVHRITADHQTLSVRANELTVPSFHWDQSKSFLDEIDRISTHRRVDIVEAPVWNIVGIAALLSGRYKVVTSLMTTLKLSLPSRPDLRENPGIMAICVEPIIDLERYLIMNSHGILAISHGIAREIEDAYNIKINVRNLHFSYLGLPDWTDSIVSATRSHADITEVLFVGRLEKRKGIDILLNVIPELANKYPNTRFHIVGDHTICSGEDQTYKEQFEQKYLSLCGSKVFFHGKINDKDLRKHYAECDIFVAPSRFESFGLIYVEAMMFGKPVIGCDVGGVPEVVINGETGILVSPGDSCSLSAAFDKLINDLAFRLRLGGNGRARYEQYFMDGKMAVESVTIYKALIHQANIIN